MDQVLIFAAAAALIGLGVLLGLARVTEPAEVALADVPKHADRTVTVVARVLSADATPSGALRLVLTDGNVSLNAFAHQPTPVLPGDLVEATGRVTKYRGVWELVVDRADDVAVLSAWDAEATPLALIADRPWGYVGMNVLTLGRAESGPAGDALVDPSTSSRLRLAGVRAVDLVDGQWTRAAGTIEYDKDGNRFQLRLSAAWPAQTPG